MACEMLLECLQHVSTSICQCADSFSRMRAHKSAQLTILN